ADAGAWHGDRGRAPDGGQSRRARFPDQSRGYAAVRAPATAAAGRAYRNGAFRRAGPRCGRHRRLEGVGCDLSGRRTTMTSTPSNPAKPGILGLSHVAIAVPDIEAAARLLHERFGFVAGEVHENA